MPDDIWERMRRDPILTERKRFEKWEYPVRIGTEGFDLLPSKCERCKQVIDSGFALGHWDLNGNWKVRHRICPKKAA